MPESAQFKGQQQNIRSFIVQVRNQENTKCLGTGFVVEGGYILTCAHVVIAAGINPCGEFPISPPYTSYVQRKFPNFFLNSFEEDLLWIRFLQAKSPMQRDYRAQVHRCLLNSYEDDVLMLKLVDSEVPPGVGYARLGLATPATLRVDPQRRRFRSYGYKQLGEYEASWCEGTTLGFVDRPVDRSLHHDPLQLDTKQASVGMSGAPVLDMESNLVIGLIAETWNDWSSFQNRDVVFATANEVMEIASFEVALAAEETSSQMEKNTEKKRKDEGTLFSNDPVSIETVIHHLSPYNECDQAISGNSTCASIRWQSLRIKCIQCEEINATWLNMSKSYCEVSETTDSSGCLLSQTIRSSFNLLRPKRIIFWDWSVAPDIEKLVDAMLSQLVVDASTLSPYLSYEGKVRLLNSFLNESNNFLVIDRVPNQSFVDRKGGTMKQAIESLIPNSSSCLLVKLTE